MKNVVPVFFLLFIVSFSSTAQNLIDTAKFRSLAENKKELVGKFFSSKIQEKNDGINIKKNEIARNKSDSLTNKLKDDLKYLETSLKILVSLKETNIKTINVLIEMYKSLIDTKKSFPETNKVISSLLEKYITYIKGKEICSDEEACISIIKNGDSNNITQILNLVSTSTNKDEVEKQKEKKKIRGIIKDNILKQ
jgi:hypothetical protein